MRVRWLLLLTGAAAWILGTATMAFAGSPGTGTVGPGDPSTGWSGKDYVVGATPTPDLCPESEDPSDLLCDHFDLTVDEESGYWDSHTGGVTVSLSWSDSTDDFDLYVYDSGNQVASSAARGTSSESAYVANAAGTYEIRVVPVLVTASGYSGSATFSSEEIPEPSPTAPPGGGGEGAGGGASGGSGDGSDDGSGDGGGTRDPGDPGRGQRTVASSSTNQGRGQASSPGMSPRSGTSPVGLTAPRLPSYVWLLLPLGVLLMALVVYAVFQPEPESVEGLADTEPPESTRLAPLPIVVAGGLIRGAIGCGRAVNRVATAAGRGIRRSAARRASRRREGHGGPVT